jgi:hypothetical protein
MKGVWVNRRLSKTGLVLTGLTTLIIFFCLMQLARGGYLPEPFVASWDHTELSLLGGVAGGAIALAINAFLVKKYR